MSHADTLAARMGAVFVPHDPSTGHVGIQRTPGGRWKAQMCRGGLPYYLGTYDTEAEAVAARQGGERTYALMTGTSL